LARSTSGPIGIFGGTFDPIHYGHLRLAEELADTVKLEQVRFMPSGTPPHRTRPGASPEDRVAMVRLAIAHNERFSVDDRETRRTGPGYTHDTLVELRRIPRARNVASLACTLRARAPRGRLSSRVSDRQLAGSDARTSST
jgi:nicotinate (nicotinamide) nucleotide adenylyltransferase